MSALKLIGRIQRLQRLQRQLGTQGPRLSSTEEVGTLLEFVPRISPRFTGPEHLWRFVKLLEQAETEAVRSLLSVPRRHGKTELVLHASARLLAKRPELTIGYASYSSKFAHAKSRLARDYAIRAGVRLRHDSRSMGEWRTQDGGGFLASGVGGSWTGRGVDILFVDDPHKNRIEAESLVKRDAVHDWFLSAGMSSVEPGGSVFVVHTRWHEDDLIGRLEDDSEVPWQVVNLPAINDGTDPGRPLGAPLWPERWPLDQLTSRKAEVGAYEWASLYQGRPRPRGASVFSGDVVLYDKLPDFGYRVAIGIDLAYTSKTTSDWSVAVVMLECDGFYYVVDVIRLQCSPPEFAARAQPLTDRYPGANWRWRAGGTELGVVSLLRDAPYDLPIGEEPIKGDKFVLAQPVAAAWNNGRIMLPSPQAAKHHKDDRLKGGIGWVEPLVSEVKSFTGQNDRHDDQIDGLGTAFDALDSSSDMTIHRVASRYS